MPRTPPLGFCGAVRRPKRMASTHFTCAPARARSCANLQKRMVSCSLSNNGRRWSAVIPEGPAAAPLRATRMFFAKMSWSRENHGPRRSKRSSRRGSRGSDGRLDSSTNARQAPSRAARPAESSPIWTARPACTPRRRRRDATEAWVAKSRLSSTDGTIDCSKIREPLGEACTWECSRLAGRVKQQTRQD